MLSLVLTPQLGNWSHFITKITHFIAKNGLFLLQKSLFLLQKSHILLQKMVSFYYKNHSFYYKNHSFYYKIHTFYYKKWSLFITKNGLFLLQKSILLELTFYIHLHISTFSIHSPLPSASQNQPTTVTSRCGSLRMYRAEIVLIMRTDRLCLWYLFTVLRLFLGKHLVEQGMWSLDLFDKEAFGSSYIYCLMNSLDS